MSPNIARVARNATTNVGRFVLSAAVHLLLTPFVVHRLGATGFGLWSLAFAALGFVGLVEFGFGTAVVRATAQVNGCRDLARRDQVLSTLAAFHLGLALVALVAVAVVSHGLVRWFSVPEEQVGAARQIIWILGLRIALVALPLGFFRNVLFGEQHITAINAVQSFAIVAYALGAWVALAMGGDVVTLAWINLAGGIAEHVVYVVLARRLVPGLKLRPRHVRRALVPELLSFSTSSFMFNISALVLLRTDPLIVNLSLPLASVALYAVALKVVENAHLLVKQAINVLAPLVAHLHNAGEAAQLRTMLVDVARHALWAGSLLAAGILALGEPALVHWVAPEFAAAAPAMSILILAVTLLIPQLVAANILAMTAYHRTVAASSVLGMAINIAASLLLVFRLGLVGVALGTLIATLIMDCWYLLWRACRVHGISYLGYLRSVFVPAAVCGVAQYLATMGLRHLWPPASLYQVVLEGLPGLVVSAFLYWAVFMRKPERVLLHNWFRR